jgi:phosphoglucosamine mutase
MSNFGMELALKEKEIPFVRANVGDRYVLEELIKNDWQIGGESSGHIICRNLISTGDGIVAALQVMHVLVESGQSLAELKGQMNKMPQTMINVRLKEKMDPTRLPKVQEGVRYVEDRLQGRGRVLLRPSGTEPVVRVMVEGEDGSLVQTLTQELADIVEAAIQ